MIITIVIIHESNSFSNDLSPSIGKPRAVVGGPGGKGVTTTRITFASRRRKGGEEEGRGGW